MPQATGHRPQAAVEMRLTWLARLAKLHQVGGRSGLPASSSQQRNRFPAVEQRPELSGPLPAKLFRTARTGLGSAVTGSENTGKGGAG